MAKFIVEIDCPDYSIEEFERDAKDPSYGYFPFGREPKEGVRFSGYISLDEAQLTRDPTDDSFYLFRLIEVRP